LIAFSSPVDLLHSDLSWVLQISVSGCAFSITFGVSGLVVNDEHNMHSRSSCGAEKLPALSAVAKFAALALLSGFATAQLATSVPGCPAPSYFGICNPYVPGVFICADDNGAISVISTWHDGPAEKAGMCPGDKIVAVDQAVAGGSSWDRLERASDAGKRNCPNQRAIGVKPQYTGVRAGPQPCRL
jgi:hypothetical protein